MANEVSANVIREDRKLEKANELTGEELAQHRWHWTLDETNARRVSIRAYAKAIGKSQSTIGPMVRGYVAWETQGARSGPSTLTECITRATVSTEKEAVVDALAKAEGTSFTAARKRHQDVHTVTSMARSRAERRGTTPADEVEQAAQDHHRAKAASQKHREDRKKSHSYRWIELEGKFSSAMRYLREALDVAEGVEFTEKEREFVADSISKVRAVLNLIDMRVTDTVSVDWDAELKKLGGA